MIAWTDIPAAAGNGAIDQMLQLIGTASADIPEMVRPPKACPPTPLDA